MCHTRIKPFFASGFAAAGFPGARADRHIEQTFANSLTAVPPKPRVSGAFYVPVYSSVSMSQGKLRADFSVTLSVHNASETRRWS